VGRGDRAGAPDPGAGSYVFRPRSRLRLCPRRGSAASPSGSPVPPVNVTAVLRRWWAPATAQAPRAALLSPDPARWQRIVTAPRPNASGSCGRIAQRFPAIFTIVLRADIRHAKRCESPAPDRDWICFVHTSSASGRQGQHRKDAGVRPENAGQETGFGLSCPGTAHAEGLIYPAAPKREVVFF